VMREDKLPPREATEKSMREITGALVGIALVLSAVFLPMAFFGGSTGVIYRQFSITVVSSMVLSVVLALTLAPALCATLLKPAHDAQTDKGWLGKFNRGYDRLQEKYADKVGGVIHRPTRYLLLYGLLLIAAAVMYLRLPTGFLPNEDQGTVMVQYTLPAGATNARTSAVSEAVTAYFLDQEKANVSTIFTINGFGFSGSGQNAGMAFVSLKDWSQRSGSANTADAIAKRAMAHFATLRDAQVFSMSPPAIDGFGQSDGFTFELQAKGATTRAELQAMRDQIVAAAAGNPSLLAVRANTLPDTPQLQVEIDNGKLQALGLSAADVNSTLSSAFGSTYINDFIDRNRVKKVYMQGDVQYRAKPEDLDRWFVRGTNASGASSMTPFSAFASSHWIYGPENLSRYNGLSSFEIIGQGATGVSSGTAMSEMEKLAATFSAGSSYSWSGLSYQERLTSGQASSLYAISLI
ncbi:efflux RND transporter permease subunit, partial [Serratia marcescens]